MKFHPTVLKSAVICSTLMASSAFAQYTFIDGTLTLSDTTDASVYWYDVLQASTISAAGSLTDTQLSVGIDDPRDTRAVYTQPVTSATLSDGSLSTLSAQSSGFTKTGTFRGPYSFTFRNFSVDFAKATLYADIETSTGSFIHQPLLVPAPTAGPQGTPFVISPEPGPDGYYHAQGALLNIVLDGTWDYAKHDVSTGTLSIFNTELHFDHSVAGGAFYHVPLLDVSFDVRFAVPEPSTYALMAAGFACLTMVARCRKARAA